MTVSQLVCYTFVWRIFMTAITIKDFKKYYGNKVGVESADFEVNEGEIFGFIGPNGAGKSTTIRAILGLLKPTSGTIKVFDIDCINNGELARKNIGYMPSEIALYGNMTGRQLLKFTCDLYKHNYDKIDDLAKTFDIEIDRKIKELSFGNKKKLMIVSALVSEPKLIILDEPTTGLDPVMQRVFFTQMKEEQKRGATILMSSHVLNDVQKICDRVGIMKNGKLMTIEKISEFKNKYLKTVQFDCDSQINSIKLKGVNNFLKEDDHYTFQYKGKINDLLQYLSEYDIKNLSIVDSDLESVFLHYYLG